MSGNRESQRNGQDGENGVLPQLSEQDIRKLHLERELLVETHHLDWPDITNYIRASEVDRDLARSDGPIKVRGRVIQGWGSIRRNARQKCGITSSVGFAEARFKGFWAVYESLWLVSASEADSCVAQLVAINERVLSETREIWEAASVSGGGWFDSVCDQPVRQVLERLEKESVIRAKRTELQRLDSDRLKRRAPSGNPILDEIRAHAPNEAAMAQLIESGGEGLSLSHGAREAIRLARQKVQTKIPQEKQDASTADKSKPTPEQIANAEAAIEKDRNFLNEVVDLRAHVFIFRYPQDFPDAAQLAIEDARFEANRQLEGKQAGSYEEHRAARVEWFWQIVSAAAREIGRAAAALHWGANRRRDLLRSFGLAAAKSAGIAERDDDHFDKFAKSEQWLALDAILLAREDIADPPAKLSVGRSAARASDCDVGVTRVGPPQSESLSSSLEGEDQIKIAEKLVREKDEVTVRHAALFLGCKDDHILRLGRKGKLQLSNTRPKKVSSQSLRARKWPSSAEPPASK